MKNRAFIEENECIGCAKCLDACPVDAIIGAPKFIHTVLIEDCIGCERCVPVCPVDCIQLFADLPEPDPHYVRMLAQRRQARLTLQKEATKHKNSYEKRKAYLEDLFKK